jgi:hypothetical protein
MKPSLLCPDFIDLSSSHAFQPRKEVWKGPGKFLLGWHDPGNLYCELANQMVPDPPATRLTEVLFSPLI